ncbi:Farnesyl pyrophosphate synthetase [Metarhizium acridum]|nr:Farnesyl pyrophosphate synthetase [Metarhizium acridum]
MDTYYTIARYKTAVGIYYHPFVLSLYYLNMATPSNISLSKDILLPMGTLYQIQNDYLDIFGHAEKKGKESTDIKENKCSWVIIQALNMCNEEERVYLREYYGKDDEETVRNIQKIFNSLSLTSAYEMEKRVQELRGMNAEVDDAEGLRKRVFDVFLDSLYRKHRS